jgi:small subunit ribosomal protein S6
MARVRHYETMFIVKATLTDEETQVEIATVRANIEKNGGTIVSADDMGTKDLAYEIEKNKRGHYYLAFFTAPSEAILELERNYRINENIIRFIFLTYDGKKEIAQWTTMSDETAKKEQK